MKYFIVSATGCVIICVSASLWGYPQRQDMMPDHPGASRQSIVLQDSCKVCHNDPSNILNVQGHLQCYGCHKSIEAKNARLFRHNEILNDKFPSIDCAGCHKLHNSGGSPLLANNELELCKSCHTETKDYASHPVVTYTDEYGRQSEIFGQDGKSITCASHCHDVHGTDYKYFCRQAPGRELCLTCHKDYQ
jgi:predicted CXXCH cytochrome family protein